MKTCLILALAVVACGKPHKLGIEGQLVFTDGGQTITALTFGPSGRRSRVIYRARGSSVISGVTSAGGSGIVFSECAVAGGCVIKSLSSAQGQPRDLVSGELPRYVPARGKLFFYSGHQESGGWLMMATLAEPTVATRIAKEPPTKLLANGIPEPSAWPPVQVAPARIVFVGPDRKLWSYDIDRGEQRDLGIGSCYAVLWRSASRRLLCASLNSGEVSFVDLNTRARKDLPDLRGGFGFVYVPSADSVLYGHARRAGLKGEAYDLFEYSFTTGRKERIERNLHIAAGLWLPAAPATSSPASGSG